MAEIPSLLTDADVSAYLAKKTNQDVIGEKGSCLLERALLAKYPGIHCWVSASAIYAGEDSFRATTDWFRKSGKQQEQMHLHDELARSGPVTKQAFGQAWNASWCARVSEWQ